MKKSIAFLAMASLCFTSMAELHIVQKKDKFGYADETGTVVIKEQYSAVTPFKDNMAKVQKGDKWGYIDPTGKQIIKIEYNTIGEFDENGVARVNKGGKYGYIRKDGTFVIKPEYEFIGSFNERGYVWVGKGKTLDVAQKGLYKNDLLIVKPQYRMLGFFQKTDSCDYADGSFFISNQTNEMTENFTKLSLSDVPYIWTDKAYKRGIMNIDGTEVIKPVLGAMGAPKDGYVLNICFNKKKNKYNYLSMAENGKKLLKKDIQKAFTEESPFHGAYAFNSGHALVYSDDNTAYLIDTYGNSATGTYTGMLPVEGAGYITAKNGLYGFVDMGAKETISPKYAVLSAPRGSSECILTAKSNETGKYGFVSTDDTQLIPFEYELATAFVNGIGYVKTSSGWGAINSSNGFIIQPRWKDMMIGQNENDSHLWAKNPDSDKWKCLSIASDSPAFEDEYDEVAPFDAEGKAVVLTGERFAVVNTDGAMIIPAMFDKENVCRDALAYIRSNNKESMKEIEAYRFNIQYHPDLHKFKLHQKIDDNMWDF